MKRKRKLFRRSVLSLLLVGLLSSHVTAFAAKINSPKIYSPSALQHSTYISTPSNYASINCYGYAIGKNVAVDPGYLSTGRNQFGENTTDDAFKRWIINDLKSLGYSVREVPHHNSTLYPNEVMIAYYLGHMKSDNLPYSNNFFEPITYHFWVKKYNGAPWYHKYGPSSGIMKAHYEAKKENISRVCNEFYNGILREGEAAAFFADPTVSCSFGYIAFDYYGQGVTPESSQPIEYYEEPQDHSAGAVFAQLERTGDRK